MITKKLSSGYTVRIKPLPPYYAELIENQLQMPDYPVRHLELASGDIVDVPYNGADKVVKIGDEDYELQMKWNAVEKQRYEIKMRRNVARVNYLLAVCVDVIAADVSCKYDSDWVTSLEAAFDNFKVPKHAGKRKLLYLKHVVITTVEEMTDVINLCVSREVSTQGIENALHGF